MSNEFFMFCKTQFALGPHAYVEIPADDDVSHLFGKVIEFFTKEFPNDDSTIFPGIARLSCDGVHVLFTAEGNHIDIRFEKAYSDIEVLILATFEVCCKESSSEMNPKLFLIADVEIEDEHDNTVYKRFDAEHGDVVRARTDGTPVKTRSGECIESVYFEWWFTRPFGVDHEADMEAQISLLSALSHIKPFSPFH